MRLKAGLKAPIAALAAALVLAGCGSGSPSATSVPETATSNPAGAAAAKKAAARARAAEGNAPKGASPTLRAIYRQFPPPQADPKVKGSAAALEAGERACAGKTPVEVKERFFAAARAHLNSEQKKMIARIGSYERHAAKDASFAAGQLAADTYEATLPASAGQYGYQGCVYALARRLERELAPRG